MVIKFLQAFNGDSIWINLKENNQSLNILIDGGTSTTYSYKSKKDGKIKDGDLKKLITLLRDKKEKLDLVILTHIDDDHIDGFLKWFSKDQYAINCIKEVWFNSGKNIKKYLNDQKSKIDALKFKEKSTLTSVKQGVNFEKYIKDKGVWNGRIFKQEDIIPWNNITFRVLSPNDSKLNKLLEKWEEKAPDSLLDTSRKNDYKKTYKELIKNDEFKEDKSPYNGSSIAFILNYKNSNFLFLGDAHPTVIVNELKKLKYSESNKLKVDFVKLSHHGSQKNTSIELLKLIETEKYIISTNGDLHNHPDKLTLARIIQNNSKAKLYFNYPQLIKKIIMEEDMQDYPNVEYLDVKTL
ncbi:ComEC/Rec2 family competence protein [Aquimarina rhabdastrellae]